MCSSSRRVVTESIMPLSAWSKTCALFAPHLAPLIPAKKIERYVAEQIVKAGSRGLGLIGSPPFTPFNRYKLFRLILSKVYKDNKAVFEAFFETLEEDVPKYSKVSKSMVEEWFAMLVDTIWAGAAAEPKDSDGFRQQQKRAFCAVFDAFGVSVTQATKSLCRWPREHMAARRLQLFARETTYNPQFVVAKRLILRRAGYSEADIEAVLTEAVPTAPNEKDPKNKKRKRK